MNLNDPLGDMLKSSLLSISSSTTKSVVSEIFSNIIEIHSQNQSLLLKKKDFQIEIFDSFIGITDLKEEYVSNYNHLRIYRVMNSETQLHYCTGQASGGGGRMDAEIQRQHNQGEHSSRFYQVIDQPHTTMKIRYQFIIAN